MHRVSFNFKIGGIGQVGVFLGNSNPNAILRHTGDVDVALGGDDMGDAVQCRSPSSTYKRGGKTGDFDREF